MITAVLHIASLLKLEEARYKDSTSPT